MIFDGATLPLPMRIRTDLCIVGSGAGGSMAAMIAAEGGLKVTVLEAGGFITPAQMTQREEVMLPQLFWDAGGRTTKDRAVRIHQGRGIGGSTMHNLNLCKRIPAQLLKRWTEERGLKHLDEAAWNALYAEVEQLITVTPIPESMRNRHNRLLEEACKSLGWRGGGLSHNRTGCLGSGFCELGCAYDSKNNALKVLVPRAVRAGAQFVTHCQAVRLVHDGGRVRGVEAVVIDPATHETMGTVTIEAQRVCLSGSATATAAMLRRSRAPAPDGAVGETLRIHPAVIAAGEFEAPVRAWEGIQQSYECTQFLEFDDEHSHRAWILPAFAHPMAVSTMVPGHGQFHSDAMGSYANLGVLSAMLHDETRGSVTPNGDLGVTIDYWPDEADRKELALGLWACAKLLFAAGARRVMIPTTPPRFIESPADIESLRELEIERGALDIVAVHPMSTVPMGDDPKQAAVGSNGKHHHVQGLWVADGSLFPTSIGVPPQLSIYSMGMHVGRAIVQTG